MAVIGEDNVGLSILGEGAPERPRLTASATTFDLHVPHNCLVFVDTYEIIPGTLDGALGNCR